MNPTELYEASSVKRVTEHANSLQDTLTTSYARSQLGRSIDKLVHFVRQSSLFQWLTAEPDPDVIVIDLRETVTVGPFLVILDRLIPLAARSWRDAGIRTLATASKHRLTAQPVRIFSVLLVIGLAVNTLLSLVAEPMTPIELGVRVAVLALALFGTRMRHSWGELTETRVYALVVALLAPPDMPTEGDDREATMNDQ